MAAWSGLGINAEYPFKGVSVYSSIISTPPDTYTPPFVPLITNNFPRVRSISHMNDLVSVPSIYDTATRYWLDMIRVASPSIYILYGSSSDLGFYPGMYSHYLTYILNNATYAQSHSYNAFCMGNEFEGNANHITIAPAITSLSRTSNVATAVSTAHGLTTGDYIMVTGADSSFNVADSENSPSAVQVTVIDANTFTYPSTGTNGTASLPGKFNWSYAQLIVQEKKIIAAVQAVFTNGPVVYDVAQGHEAAWVTAGLSGQGVNTTKFLLGCNFYGDSTNEAGFVAWRALVDECWAAFGNKMILTEMNVNSNWNNSTVKNMTPLNAGFEEAWEDEVMRRINYAQNLGITQVYFFTAWYGTNEWSAFYDIYPDTGVSTGTGYYVGNWKPIINRLTNTQKQYTFFGTQEGQSPGVVKRNGFSLTASQSRKLLQPAHGNCLDCSTTGDMVAPVSYAWGSRWTCRFKATIRSVPNSAARLIDNGGSNGILMTGTAFQVTSHATNMTSDNIIDLGVEHEYAIVYDGAYLNFYRDGSLLSQKAFTTDPYSSTYGFYLFNRSDGLRNCDMKIRGFRWYNKGMTQTQVFNLFRGGEDSSSLVVHYKLNEGSGTTAHDSSGNGLDATITGTVWSTF